MSSRINNDFMQAIKQIELGSSSSGISTGDSSNSSNSGYIPDKATVETVLSLLPPVRRVLEGVNTQFAAVAAKVETAGDGQACLTDAQDYLSWIVTTWDMMASRYAAGSTIQPLPVSRSA